MFDFEEVEIKTEKNQNNINLKRPYLLLSVLQAR